MNTIRFTLLLISLLLSSLLIFSYPLDTPSIPERTLIGNWQGTLAVGNAKLRIVFKITRKPNGALSAVMDSPDQGAANLPTDTVIVKAGSITIRMQAIGGAYEGAMKNDSTIDGNWSQNGVNFPLVLFRRDQVAALRRPQEPHPPFPYREEEISYKNTPAGVTLGGTLTMPPSGGPFPAVLLITGSGQQDRDEALMGHKPFLVVADYLTKRGIAVLRVDDRGVGKSTGDFAASTTKDFAGDVEAGLLYLASRKEIDPDKIGLLGHSEGGIIAPMVAAHNPHVAFIVLLAGSAIPGDSLLLLQEEAIARAGNVPEEAVEKHHALFRRIFTAVEREQDTAGIVQAIRRIADEEFPALSPEERQSLGIDSTWVGQVARQMQSSWMRYFLSYDPRPALRSVQCPVLALNGAKDLQVPASENLQAINQALREGKNRDHLVKEIPGLNHLFQHAQTGSPAEYGKIEETIAPEALEMIGDWILKH